jgi:hypothetical protein
VPPSEYRRAATREPSDPPTPQGEG